MPVGESNGEEARFEQDRATQCFDDSDSVAFAKRFSRESDQMRFESFQSRVGAALANMLGVIHHQLPCFDHATSHTQRRTLTETLRPIHAFQNGAVHTLKLARGWIDAPKTLVDELHGQYAPMTTHLARLTNSSLNLTMLCDVIYIVQSDPGVVAASAAAAAAAATPKHTSRNRPPPPPPVPLAAPKPDSERMAQEQQSQSIRAVLQDTKTGPGWPSGLTELVVAYADLAEGSSGSAPKATVAGAAVGSGAAGPRPSSGSVEADGADDEAVRVRFAAYRKPKKTKASLEKRPLPEGWAKWPVTRIELHSRVPIYEFPLMTMSGWDPRANGNGPKDALVHEDWVDHGCGYRQSEMELVMPMPSGRLYNEVYVYGWNSASEASGRVNWSYPDLKEPFAVRNRRIMLGFYQHSSEVQRYELRSCHPTRLNYSTATLVMKVFRFNRYDLNNGFVMEMQYQYQQEHYSPTIPLLALGLSLTDIVGAFKRVAGPHYYPDAFDKTLQLLIDRHPRHIKDARDAAIFFGDLACTANGQQKMHSTKKQQVWTVERKLETGREFIRHQFMPGVGTLDSSAGKKIWCFLEGLHAVLMKMCGCAPHDLKTSFLHEREELNGLLHAGYQRRSLPKFTKRVFLAFQTMIRDGHPFHRPTLFDSSWTEDNQTTMTTGYFSADKKGAGPSRKDASMALRICNQYGHLQCRRMNAAAAGQRKCMEARGVSRYQWGHKCPVETPEGNMCGLVHSKAAGSTVSPGSSMRALILILERVLGTGRGGAGVLQPIDGSFEPVSLERQAAMVRAVLDEKAARVSSARAATTASGSNGVGSVDADMASTKIANRKLDPLVDRRRRTGGARKVPVEPPPDTPASGAAVAARPEGAPSRLASAPSTSPPPALGRSEIDACLRPEILTHYPSIPLQLKRDDPLCDEYAASEYVWYRVSVDGAVTWLTRDPERVLATVRGMRRNGEIDPYVSCHLDRNSLRIRTAVGRNVRPILVLARWHQLLSEPTHAMLAPHRLWTGRELLSLGLVEFVDPLEEQCLVTATSVEDLRDRTLLGERFSHMDVLPWMMKGIAGAMCPFGDQDMGARLTLFVAMLKQAFVNTTNPLREYTTRQTMYYPQRPLCYTQSEAHYHLGDLSAGPQAKVVFLNKPGNQDDAMDLNEMSAEFGFGLSSRSRKYTTATKKLSAMRNGKGAAGAGGSGAGSGTGVSLDLPSGTGKSKAAMNYVNVNAPSTSTFENPASAALRHRTTTLKFSSYDKIGDVDAMPALGEYIEGGDVAIARTYQTGSMSDGCTEKTDDSLLTRPEDRGLVVTKLATCNEANTMNLRLLEVCCMTPHRLGDKFSSEHGQKGVIGAMSRVQPFSCDDGASADFFTSVQGVSRLTDGHYMEHAMGLIAVRSGRFVDATMFENMTRRQQHADIVQQLQDMGGHVSQMQSFISGETGVLMDSPLCVGYMTWMKLRHIAAEKAHACGFGPVQATTRQPTEGKQRDGGHRLGYMELHALDAQGAAAAANERTNRESDGVPIPYCTRCKQMAISNPDTQHRDCQLCWNGDKVVMANTVWTAKLSTHEWAAMGMATSPSFTDETRPVSFIPRAVTPPPPPLTNADEPYTVEGSHGTGHERPAMSDGDGVLALPMPSALPLPLDSPAAVAPPPHDSAVVPEAGHVYSPEWGQLTPSLRARLPVGPYEGQTEWLKLTTMPRPEPAEWVEMGMAQPQPLPWFARNLSSVHQPIPAVTDTLSRAFRAMSLSVLPAPAAPVRTASGAIAVDSTTIVASTAVAGPRDAAPSPSPSSRERRSPPTPSATTNTRASPSSAAATAAAITATPAARTTGRALPTTPEEWAVMMRGACAPSMLHTSSISPAEATALLLGEPLKTAVGRRARALNTAASRRGARAPKSGASGDAETTTSPAAAADAAATPVTKKRAPTAKRKAGFAAAAPLFSGEGVPLPQPPSLPTATVAKKKGSSRTPRR